MLGVNFHFRTFRKVTEPVAKQRKESSRMSDQEVKTIKKGSIGFTMVEDGTRTLPNGEQVPMFKGWPNDPEAHRRLIEGLKRDLKKSA